MNVDLKRMLTPVVMKTHIISLLIPSLLLFATSSRAALVIDFGGADPTPNGAVMNFSSLTDGSPVLDPDASDSDTADPTNWNNAGPGATVSDVLTGASAGDTFSFTVNAFSSVTLSGNSVTASTSNGNGFGKNPDAGWGVANDGGDLTGSQALAFTFDLAGLSLSAGEALRITQITLKTDDVGSTTDSGTPPFEVTTLVDGVSSNTFTTSSTNGDPLTNLAIDIQDGDTLYFTPNGASDDGYRVNQVQFEIIPEPSSLALVAMGGIAVLGISGRRRKK